MRYAVVLALVLAVMLSLTQTVAMQSAAVTSQQTIPVTSTSAALLSLAPGSGDGNGGGVAYLQGNNLLLDFRKGFGATSWGFLRNGLADTDKYRFKNLFTITNSSGSSQDVTVTVSGTAPDIAGIYVRPDGTPLSDTGTQVATTGGAYLTSYTLAAGGVLEVDFWFEITSTTVLIRTFDVRVEATRP
ncbi:MAG TPA: hypothetical protein VD902_18030 [Symbiobacteriaceae bacterium]|nr:hypothetical protein [Symbiobacteriaceae bacterium]